MAATAAYVAPAVEVYEVTVEKGFAGSTIGDESESDAAATLEASPWGK
jgi:hypothetical protein